MCQVAEGLAQIAQGFAGLDGTLRDLTKRKQIQELTGGKTDDPDVARLYLEQQRQQNITLPETQSNIDYKKALTDFIRGGGQAPETIQLLNMLGGGGGQQGSINNPIPSKANPFTPQSSPTSSQTSGGISSSMPVQKLLENKLGINQSMPDADRKAMVDAQQSYSKWNALASQVESGLVKPDLLKGSLFNMGGIPQKAIQAYDPKFSQFAGSTRTEQNKILQIIGGANLTPAEIQRFEGTSAGPETPSPELYLTLAKDSSKKMKEAMLIRALDLSNKYDTSAFVKPTELNAYRLLREAMNSDPGGIYSNPEIIRGRKLLGIDYGVNQ